MREIEGRGKGERERERERAQEKILKTVKKRSNFSLVKNSNYTTIDTHL